VLHHQLQAHRLFRQYLLLAVVVAAQETLQLVRQ
jgi:hypothetical protein